MARSGKEKILIAWNSLQGLCDRKWERLVRLRIGAVRADDACPKADTEVYFLVAADCADALLKVMNSTPCSATPVLIIVKDQ